MCHLARNTSILASFGGSWLAVNSTNFFSPDAGNWLKRQGSHFLLLGIAIAIWRNWPKNRFACRLTGRDVAIEIRVGDLFDLPGAFVIGINTSFDTNIESGTISKRSVQGQFTEKYYDSVAHLDTDLTKALAGVTPERTSNTKIGKPEVYPVGTTVHVRAKGRHAYFVAIATMNDSGVAHGTFDMSTPVFAQGTVVAVLSVYTARPSGFSDEDGRGVGTLAEELALEFTTRAAGSSSKTDWFSTPGAGTRRLKTMHREPSPQTTSRIGAAAGAALLLVVAAACTGGPQHRDSAGGSGSRPHAAAAIVAAIRAEPRTRLFALKS